MARPGYEENAARHLEGHLALGAAVLRQAVSDARRSDDVGEEARHFLSGSHGLRWWCEALGLDQAAFTAQASSDRQH
jgi:hypothetical protein